MPGVLPNEAQIYQYRDNLDKELSKIKLLDEVMNCDQINCFDKSHLHQIDDFGVEILKCCLSASNTSNSCLRKKKAIPKWNEVAKPANETAPFWHSIRRSARVIYHKLFKELKAKQTVNGSKTMAQAFHSNNNCDFCRESKKFKPNKKMILDTMDGIQ